MKLGATDDPRPGVWRHSAAGFLATLALMFATEACIERIRGGRIATALLPLRMRR